MASLDVFGHGSAVKVSPGEARRVRVSQVGPVRASYGPSRCVESWKGGRGMSGYGESVYVWVRRSSHGLSRSGEVRNGEAVQVTAVAVCQGMAWVLSRGESVCHS